MRTIKFEAKLTEEQVDELGGTFLSEKHFDTLITDSAIGLKPDGSLLFVFVKNVLDPVLCRRSVSVLRHAAKNTTNRGIAAGKITDDYIAELNASHAQSGRNTRYVRTGQRMTRVLENGKRSKTLIAKSVESGIMGYFDRNSRFPYCRQTAFDIEHHESLHKVMPFVRAVDKVFKEHAPKRYEAQRSVVENTNKDFVINDTIFTTITVNRNFRTACHKDAGDYKPGFGVLTVLQKGRYGGGFFCLPKFRAAIDMRTTDVLLADVHEWHGNTEILPCSPDWERISCVFYYREKMHECGSAVEERQRAAIEVSGIDEIQKRSRR